MFDYTPPAIPPKVIEYVNKNMSQYNNNDSGILYLMKWKGQKIYCPYFSYYNEKTVNYPIFGPIILAYDRKTVRRLINIDEYLEFNNAKQKYYDKRSKHCYKKLYKNIYENQDKLLEIKEETLPPKIPSSVVKYADLYILKHKNRKIDYVFDWNGQHIYRICYMIRPKANPHKKILVAYDGNTVRMLTEEEINKTCYNYSDYYFYTIFNKKSNKYATK